MGEKHITCPSCRVRTFVQDTPWKRLCVTCYLEQNPTRRRKPELAVFAPQPMQAIDADMLRRLVYLCHPDKHAGSDAAHKATAFLLKLNTVHHFESEMK